MAATIDYRVAELERANAELQRRLDACRTELEEAREQQTATAEVLQVINSSPGDLAPVFDAILEKAHGLCQIALGALELHENGKFRAVAVRGVSGPLAELLRQPFEPPSESPLARLIAGEQVVQITDMSELARLRPDDPRAQAGAQYGLHTALFVPLRKDAELLGQIVAFRQEERPFSEKEIALLQNFAAQAVIAMENARLLTETREALEQQTATAEVLQVINSSPGDLAPVFDAILERAHTLCGADYGALLSYDGERFWPIAGHGGSARFADMIGADGILPPTDGGLWKLTRGAPFAQIVDMAEIAAQRPHDRMSQALVEIGGIRTQLVVSLRKDETLLGAITANRRDVRPFSDKEVALLQNFATQAVIAMENARLLTETREALEQQTATAEVLQVINSSPGDLAPVFDAMLEKALELCGASFGTLWIRDGELFHAAALRRVPEAYAQFLARGPVQPSRGSGAGLGSILDGGDFFHLLDAAAEPGYQGDNPGARALIELGGARTTAGVPLRKDGGLLGAITIYRQEVRPFSEKEIALLQNFAAQAVIAMENARLLTETREALEQQTATAEVLQVINSSPGDLAPVFDSILDKALGLCGAAFGALHTIDGKVLRLEAQHGLPPRFAEFAANPVNQPGPGGATSRLMRDGGRFVHVIDLKEKEAYRSGDPYRRALVDIGGARTLLAVPLRKDSAMVGVINIYRQEVRPYTEKQIALLENFAAQAVIAMENARLLTETREALEQQTATAEVLQVINSSPGDLAPVFDAILEKAHTLCGAAHGGLMTFDGETARAVAVRGIPEPLSDFLRSGFAPHPGSPPERLIRGERFVQIPDVVAAAEDPEGLTRAWQPMVEAGTRTLLFVPLRKDGTLLGYITAAHVDEVQLFSYRQITLLENFAAQAVIAMENARLLTETREALEQQTATAEVLQVINSSPGDLTPVFDAMLDRALHLCEAAFGLLHAYDGERFRALAVGGISGAAVEPLREWVADPGSALERIVRGDRVVHIPDVVDTDAYRSGVASRLKLVKLTSARTALWVALRKDDALLGVFVIYRREVRPFSDKQIALLQNFAAQAVIAMENARLLTETREALEQQTATAEVLQVINSSPGDLAPVFDAILEKAHNLCGVAAGALMIFEGEDYRVAAIHGTTRLGEYWPRGTRLPLPPSDEESPLPRLLRGERLIHLADATTDRSYRSYQRYRNLIDAAGARTFLMVPLRNDDHVLGIITAYRQEVRPFTDKQIALLENFAAQAVIAMENARLITETREALEQQTATAEVLQVINSSPGDLAPVFDAILEKARAVCGFAHGSLNVYDGEYFRTVAMHGYPEAFAKVLRQPRRTGPQARFLEGDRIVHITDVAAERPASDDPVYRAAIEAGVRTVLFVPLRNDQNLLGYLTANRREARPFSDKQIALLQNFAAQAVIAMENARLITETREALEQQTATAEVLQVINSSPGDLAPVFDAMLDKAMRLCEAAFGILSTYDGEHFHAVALHGVPQGYAATYLGEPYRPGRGTIHDRLIHGERLVHIPDLSADIADDRGRRTVLETLAVRTLLAVPLRKDGTLLGIIHLYRQEVRPFTDKQVALLENFAAQAVIAMENARLITELRERTRDLQESLEYQTAISDVLKVISRSTFDLDAVMEAVVTSAIRLCRADCAGIYRNVSGEYRWTGAPSSAYEEHERDLVILPGPGTVVGRAALEGHAVQIADAWTDPLYEAKDDAREGGVHTMLGVPLLREGSPIGVIGLARKRVELFTDKQIELVTTFADQAVIAIENARLFNELRARTDDLQESLEYQTAISDVLKVISRSTFDLQTVLQTVVTTAIRLCRADSATIYRNEGGEYRWAAGHMLSPEYEEIERAVRIRPGTGTLVGRATMEGRTVQILDAWTDPLYQAKDDARVGGVHTMIGVPLLRENAPIGVIGLARRRVEVFTEREIALVTTFADQAVIAIENARLIDELRDRTAELGRLVEELKMLGEVGRAVSATLDLKSVLSTILTASLGVTWANAGAVFRYSRAERAFRLVEAVGLDETFTGSVRDLSIAEAETAMREATARREPIQLSELAERPSAPLRDAALAAGFHSALIVPLVGAERVFGAITLMRQEAGEFPVETVRLMQTLASQSVLAIQNARLFREIADKSEQLALASQHKSQFLANMSHELRTPLNAILGYAELLADGIYGVLPEKAQGVLERVQNNGRHLLVLINDVLDLAKIEAGQLTLTLEDYALSEVVRSVVTATEPLAAAKGLKFTAIVEDGMPMAHGDARRVSQVLLNLAGNAIKFTDAGEVAINASAGNGQFVLTVRDTGPGIADADQERIFGEFQQIDNSDTRKKGGTGLGLAISKRMVEMQGGMISVDSVLGAGSTFRVVLPVHVEPALEEAA